MSWSLGNYWYLFLLLLLPLLASFMIRFLKWRNRKREIFASSQFHDNLFEKNQDLQNFSPHYICWVPCF